ncbi:HEPN domain-containing protein [Pseudomonas viridiflava]|uniref:HEPN domain-containing protein n=1 Tax=Pseudomonas viridiflava TaxID=33069 RepID=A0ABU7N532_PSEVI|nr:HEPN domain-containing protein [Pseudomonas viridiflava]MEE4040037.1 HEPN domain-containing protein [Pseudomonas viridiflava]MEE4058282.1 HEPN domain-containing protein [Pseudomonas viridiflava]MEE4168511.1 HEPN domain-containing protein [Pseudomonas viridiflava]
MLEDADVELSGFFWVPEDPEKKLAGKLVVKKDGGVSLEVVGAFNESAVDNDMSNSKILGLVDGNEKVTILQCFYTVKVPFEYGLNKSSLVANQLFLGHCFENQVAGFNYYSFGLDNLDEWAGYDGVDVKRFKSTWQRIEFKLPKTKSFMLNNNMKLSIVFGYKLKGGLGSATIEQSTRFQLYSKQQRPLADFQECAFYIENFISLAINDMACSRRREVKSTSVYIPPQDRGKRRMLPVRYIFPSSNYRPTPVKVHWQRMLFTLASIGDLSKALNAWFDIYRNVEPALDLYFSVAHERKAFSHSKFLALAQALETFHRRTNSDTLRSASEFEEFSCKILDSSSESTREWLESKLKHGNELPFRQRLKSLVAPIKKHIGSAGDVKSLVNKILDSRNYYTHYDSELEGRAAKGMELYQLSVRMEALLKVLFLQKLGFEGERLENALSYQVKKELNPSFHPSSERRNTAKS